MDAIVMHGGLAVGRTEVPGWVAALAAMFKRRRRVESQRPPRPHPDADC